MPRTGPAPLELRAQQDRLVSNAKAMLWLAMCSDVPEDEGAAQAARRFAGHA